MTSKSLWNYYRDEVNDNTAEVNADNYRTNNIKTTISRSFSVRQNKQGAHQIIIIC